MVDLHGFMTITSLEKEIIRSIDMHGNDQHVQDGVFARNHHLIRVLIVKF